LCSHAKSLAYSCTYSQFTPMSFKVEKSWAAVVDFPVPGPPYKLITRVLVKIDYFLLLVVFDFTHQTRLLPQRPSFDATIGSHRFPDGSPRHCFPTVTILLPNCLS